MSTGNNLYLHFWQGDGHNKETAHADAIHSIRLQLCLYLLLLKNFSELPPHTSVNTNPCGLEESEMTLGKCNATFSNKLYFWKSY